MRSSMSTLDESSRGPLRSPTMTRTAAPSLLGPEPHPSHAGPVKCLGLTFPDDDARRAHFLDRLREHLADPESLRAEGFPRGEVEDIHALSDPPYFTACP